MSPPDSTTGGKDLQPYWNDYTKAISSQLWLPTGTASPASAPSSSSKCSSKTVANSWFSTSADLSPPEELTQDLLAILTVFSARVNGLRRYRKEIQEDKNLPRPAAESQA